MNVWIVIDRYDHSETITTAHLTEKGAMIQAYNILLEAYDNLVEHDETGGIDSTKAEFKEGYPDAYDFVEKNRMNIGEAKLADLNEHECDLASFVGEWTEWSTNVEVQQAWLQA